MNATRANHVLNNVLAALDLPRDERMNTPEDRFYEDTVNPFARIKRDTEWAVFRIGQEAGPVERRLTQREASARADALNREHGFPVENRS